MIADLEQSIESGNLEQFGEHMHELQDTFSHAGYEWWSGGHIADGTDPDYYDPQSHRDTLMERWSRYYLDKYYKQNCKE